MTAPSTATPSAPDHRDPAVHPVTPDRLQWLEGELTRWQAEGLLGPDAAQAIRGRYVASRRFTLSRIVLTLGACFVGLGLVWLVASNLDAMAPLVRFLLMVAIWLGLVVASELLAARRTRAGDVASPGRRGALRLLAAARLRRRRVPGRPEPAGACLRAPARRGLGPRRPALGVCRARRRAARAGGRPAGLLVRLGGARAPATVPSRCRPRWPPPPWPRCRSGCCTSCSPARVAGRLAIDGRPVA